MLNKLINKTEKANKDYYFDDSLIDFYEKSNEVEAFCNLFQNKILHETTRFKNIKRWLDVGIGDGEKILKALQTLNDGTEIDLTYLEPSDKWRLQFLSNGNCNNIKNIRKPPKNITVNLKGYNKTFEEYVNTNTTFDFDLISFITVLYEPHLVNTLFEFIKNKRNNKNFWLLINIEHDNNDFCKIRKILSQSSFNPPISQLQNIESKLKEQKIKYNKYDSDDKILNITPQEIINNKNHWLYPFLMGCSYKDYKTLYSENEQNKIYKLVKQYLQKHYPMQNENKIDINDTTIFAKIRK